MEPTEQRQYKRKLKSVFIHKPMQREFTLVVISLLIVSALAVAYVIHYTIQQGMLGGGYRFGKISAYEVMSDVGYDLITRVSLILFINMFLIAMFGVFFLHRLAGPVYRFHGILRRVSGGEIPEDVHLREGDFFTDTAEDLNKVLQLLRDLKLKTKAVHQKLEECLKKGSLSSSDPALLEIMQLLGKMT